MKRRIGLSVLVLMLAACSSPATADETSSSPKSSMLIAAADSCEVPASAIGDGGYTITLDGQGKDDRELVDGKVVYPEGKLDIKSIACVLRAIGTPDSVIGQIDQTRALDGRPTAENDGYSYSWTYHPDHGLDLIVTDGRTHGA